ncbi:MAG: hypothetical protein ABC596_05720 [Candidatus Methanosuratincola petrocarbonis]
MPQPTTSEVHIDTALSEIALGYKLEAEAFIADKVFPTVPVKKQSDKIFKFDKDYWLRISASIRAPGTESAGGGFSISQTTSYFCDIHAIHQDLPEPTRKNADIEDLEIQVTEWVTQQLLLERERTWVARFFDDAGKSEGTDFWEIHTGVDSGPGDDQFLRWNDANSDPVTDINNGIVEIAKKTGVRPNILVLGPEVYATLKTNPKVKELLAYAPTAPDVTPLVTPEMLAKIWDLDQVLVSWATHTSSQEGASSISYDFIFGKHALLVYAPKKPGILIPTGGYNFEWTEYGNFPVPISTFPMPELKAERIEGEMAYALMLLGPDLGVFYKTAIA